ncbi:hypothetical protein FOYG_05088 [Fusarium oxysporum NRRL 32931]|uniref:Uncharacterized protein n=1 Tax=Fusarium oxysporum NRRL 32931 TaxID=660029 RepID=W9IN29_FUSOX|nr:hypothetical protein FOYG_05088 [Fusarium oxysporum NRRL 32931]
MHLLWEHKHADTSRRSQPLPLQNCVEEASKREQQGQLLTSDSWCFYCSTATAKPSTSTSTSKGPHVLAHTRLVKSGFTRTPLPIHYQPRVPVQWKSCWKVAENRLLAARWGQKPNVESLLQA